MHACKYISNHQSIVSRRALRDILIDQKFLIISLKRDESFLFSVISFGLVKKLVKSVTLRKP